MGSPNYPTRGQLTVNKRTLTHISRAWAVISILVTTFLWYLIIKNRHMPLNVQAHSYERNKAFSTNSTTEVTHTKVFYSGKPTRIIVEQFNIDLPVIDGVYDKRSRSWSLSFDAAHYALITPSPNTVAGNTFIYGHNTKSIFGELEKLTKNDQVKVVTDKGDKFLYSLRDVKEVAPTDVASLTPTTKPMLTIQTCSGNWDEKRMMLTFELIDVKPFTTSV